MRSGHFRVPTGRVRACQESREFLCVSNLTEYMTKGQEGGVMHFLAKLSACVLHHDHTETAVCGFTSCLRHTDGGRQAADGERIDTQIVEDLIQLRGAERATGGLVEHQLARTRGTASSTCQLASFTDGLGRRPSSFRPSWSKSFNQRGKSCPSPV